MGCLLSLPETSEPTEEIGYVHGVDFYFEDISDENIHSDLYFFCD